MPNQPQVYMWKATPPINVSSTLNVHDMQCGDMMFTSALHVRVNHCESDARPTFIFGVTKKGSLRLYLNITLTSTPPPSNPLEVELIGTSLFRNRSCTERHHYSLNSSLVNRLLM